MKETGYFLSHLYASRESILTSLLQFQYQLFFLEDTPLKNKMKKFLERDYKHLQILARFLIKNNQHPFYADKLYGSVLYWNGFNVYYDTDIKTMLEVDITLKKKMIQNTEMVIYVVESEEVKHFLRGILKEEYQTLEELTVLLEHCA